MPEISKEEIIKIENEADISARVSYNVNLDEKSNYELGYIAGATSEALKYKKIIEGMKATANLTSTKL